MAGDEEQSILSFLRREAVQGHFETTTAEIAAGTSMSYNQVARVLERLLIMEEIGYRERGTERKAVRYFYLKDVLNLCREKSL